MRLKAYFVSANEKQNRETVSEGDTARETVIRLEQIGGELPSDIESAVLRVDLDPVVEITLEENADGDWQFQWSAGNFVSLPAISSAYTAQVKATCEDSTVAYFPTASTLEIKVNEPI